MSSEEQKITEMRQRIDRIDEKIVKQLNERAKLVLAIRELKNLAKLPIFDPHREQEILTKLALINDGPLKEDPLKEIYAKILACMKNNE